MKSKWCKLKVLKTLSFLWKLAFVMSRSRTILE